MIVFWVLGAPFLVLFILVRNRKNLEEPFIKKYFLLLYQGLKPKAFYWEFINTIRKIIMPAFNVFLAAIAGFYRAMIAIMVLVLLFRLQHKIQPYKLQENNLLEMLAIITGMITLFGGILFLDDSEDSVPGLQLFALVIIVFTNIYFIFRWLHLLLYSFRSQHPILLVTRRILGYALLRNKTEPMSTDASKYVKTDFHETPKKKVFKKKKVS